MYTNSEGDQSSLLIQKNQQQFFAKFTKRSKTKTKILWKFFYEHFKAIATTQDADDTESGNKGLDFNSIFEELHVDLNKTISIEEAIGNLKPGKSHDEDGILKEY